MLTAYVDSIPTRITDFSQISSAVHIYDYFIFLHSSIQFCYLQLYKLYE